jgi:hypothetical protein
MPNTAFAERDHRRLLAAVGSARLGCPEGAERGDEAVEIGFGREVDPGAAT